MGDVTEVVKDTVQQVIERVDKLASKLGIAAEPDPTLSRNCKNIEFGGKMLAQVIRFAGMPLRFVGALLASVLLCLAYLIVGFSVEDRREFVDVWRWAWDNTTAC